MKVEGDCCSQSLDEDLRYFQTNANHLLAKVALI